MYHLKRTMSQETYLCLCGHLVYDRGGIINTVESKHCSVKMWGNLAFHLGIKGHTLLGGLEGHTFEVGKSCKYVKQLDEKIGQCIYNLILKKAFFYITTHTHAQPSISGGGEDKM